MNDENPRKRGGMVLKGEKVVMMMGGGGGVCGDDGGKGGLLDGCDQHLESALGFLLMLMTARWGFEATVVATPFKSSLDLMRIADEAQFKYDACTRVLGREIEGLPLYGVGHSLGALIHLIIGSRYATNRTGKARGMDNMLVIYGT
ncbi:hypothetical protein CYMTET_25417 [Cymbomonas tetramitiformis]|uniref:Uncharacterized protein n=1 Tax=Cymbomonas tetramitiformis TaxID=36881 RepID=A0AAE0FVE7_9CHLO|nr:hypothetical protein CYMTET_25417 [Cymbomonas tetramitiformis]